MGNPEDRFSRDEAHIKDLPGLYHNGMMDQSHHACDVYQTPGVGLYILEAT